MTTPRWILIDTWTDKAGLVHYTRIAVDVGLGHVAEPVFDTKKAAYSYMRDRGLSKGFRPVRAEMKFEVSR